MVKRHLPAGFIVPTQPIEREKPPAGPGGTKLRLKDHSFTIDGKAVVLGPDGLSRFDEFRRRASAPHRCFPLGARFIFDLCPPASW
jgi:hypothetical protein